MFTFHFTTKYQHCSDVWKSHLFNVISTRFCSGDSTGKVFWLKKINLLYTAVDRWQSKKLVNSGTKRKQNTTTDRIFYIIFFKYLCWLHTLNWVSVTLSLVLYMYLIKILYRLGWMKEAVTFFHWQLISTHLMWTRTHTHTHARWPVFTLLQSLWTL